jgi:hypothetical protein
LRKQKFRVEKCRGAKHRGCHSQGLKVLYYFCFGRRLKPSSHSRDSGLVNSRYKVSNLRDYETLKTLRTDILAKNGSFVSDKALLFWQQKFSQSFMIFGRKGKEKTTLDHKYQIFSNLCEPDEPEEGEHLFHSQMWVKGTPLHFIVDSGSQKNLISAEVVKRLALPTTPHPQPYTIGWLHQGSDLHVSQQCRLSYDIKPFKDEVLCDVSPLEVCDVLLGQPYLWKHHVVYESRPHSVIITLNKKLYRIPEAVPPSVISLISAKQCRKVISQTGKFVFFMIHSQNE